MATVSWTATAANLNRLADALADKWGYRETINGTPNPESKAAFTHRMQAREWKQTVVQYERRLAIAAAVGGVPNPTDPDIT